MASKTKALKIKRKRAHRPNRVNLRERIRQEKKVASLLSELAREGDHS